MKLVNGIIAGIVGTLAMTIVMRELAERTRQRKPMPPRQITENVLAGLSNGTLPAATTASHFGYGGAAGAVLALMGRAPSATKGAAYGVAVWIVSYFGWIPALQILPFPTKHPPTRTAVMIAAHLVWGAVTALSLREISKAEQTIFRRPAE
jgi:uncharacterized membrane protein YagU involved in acid resistance